MPHDRSMGGAELDLSMVAGFLRRLAERVERDPAFGSAVAAVLTESGLLTLPPASRGRGSASSGARATAQAAFPEGAAPGMDPFAVRRQRGEDGLRTALDELDVTALHQLVRAHRLDPARVSSRWTNRQRLIALIIDQVRARADHGKAFARI